MCYDVSAIWLYTGKTRLEGIGFSEQRCHAHEVRLKAKLIDWDEMFEELKTFHSPHGHCYSVSQRKHFDRFKKKKSQCSIQIELQSFRASVSHLDREKD